MNKKRSHPSHSSVFDASASCGFPAQMKTFRCGSAPSDCKSRSCLLGLFVPACLIFAVYFISNEFIGKEYEQRLTNWQATIKAAKSTECNNLSRPPGSEALPQGIVARTSNFEMRHLWNTFMDSDKPKHSKSLLALAVGIKQKEVVNQIVRKFPPDDFVIMLFHYDGIVDQWRNFSWSDHAIHVSAANQTKWWFAKRFLHPDIVAEYRYIFLWDEDLGVDNFDPKQYISIVKDEGLEISQPAVDATKSQVHHLITARSSKSKVHRRLYKYNGSEKCNETSTAPPCVGWVEMMAPVFSRAAWRCVWYMIQNDLIYAWGLDLKLGYCAQGDRTKNVGVVDSQYIVHLDLPTLGVFNGTEAPSKSHKRCSRSRVRKQSSTDMHTFDKRWERAVEEDKCWVDPYRQLQNQTSH